MLVPAGDLPGRPSKCSLAWQRGAKLQYTAAAFVDGQEHVVYWDETLKQVRGKPLREQSLGSFLMDVYCWGCCWIPVRLTGLHGRQLCDISSVLPATKTALGEPILQVVPCSFCWDAWLVTRLSGDYKCGRTIAASTTKGSTTRLSLPAHLKAAERQLCQAWALSCRWFVNSADDHNALCCFHNTDTISHAALQSTSMVKDGHRFLPKEYSLKLQAVGQGKGGEQRQTIAKCRLDLGRYCSCDQVFAQEVTLELK